MNPYVYIQIRDKATYLPKLFDPQWLSSQGVSWEIQEQGGTAQINVYLGVSWETTPVNPGDFLEVWVTGESVPRCRGIVSTPESILDLKESKAIIATGRMADMDKVVDYKVIVHPNGSAQDVSLYAGELFSDYQQRKAASSATAPALVSDVETIGINLDQLVLAPGTIRQGMDAIYNQTGGNCVWGWDIDPATGNDRFYLRARTAGVQYQYFVGNNVKLLDSPQELTPVVNGILLLGGNATYPNIVTNASYEQPINPGADAGDLLTDGGFEVPFNEPTDPARGGNSDFPPWVGSGGITRNGYSPSTNHNGSPHSGAWYLLLDSTSKSIYQLVAASSYAVGTSFIAYLYARNESDVHLATGLLTITEVDGSGNQVAGTPATTLVIAPGSVIWTGGAIDSVIGNDSLQTLFQKTSASTISFKVAITCTSTSGAGYGLMIDDVVMATTGSLGQYGWGTHLRNITGDAFGAINWASSAAAWDGAYGVRAVVTQASFGNECYLNPAGPDLDPDSEFHFQPMPQQNLIFGARIRMKPGGGSGLVRMEWREWASDGHQDNYRNTDDQTIPDDGTWYTLVGNTSAHGDVKTASMQIVFVAPGQYDIDGVVVRDYGSAEAVLLAGLSGWSTSSGSGSCRQLLTNDSSQQSPVTAVYLRGTQFEKYITAEEVCTSGTAAYLSASVWGRREAVITNEQIIDWTPDAITWAQAYFNRNAVLLSRPRVDLIGELATQPTPGSGLQVQISGTMADIAPQWVSKATYTWQRQSLNIALELNNERPTIAKLLLATALNAVQAGGGSTASVGAPSGGGNGGSGPVTTVSAGPVEQIDVFSPSGSTAVFMLSQIPYNGLVKCFRQPDGLKLPQSAISSVSGATITFTGNVDAGTNSLEVVYFYTPVTT